MAAYIASSLATWQPGKLEMELWALRIPLILNNENRYLDVVNVVLYHPVNVFRTIYIVFWI
jgi:hypothetical protein